MVFKNLVRLVDFSGQTVFYQLHVVHLLLEVFHYLVEMPHLWNKCRVNCLFNTCRCFLNKFLKLSVHPLLILICLSFDIVLYSVDVYKLFLRQLLISERHFILKVGKLLLEQTPIVFFILQAI